MRSTLSACALGVALALAGMAPPPALGAAPPATLASRIAPPDRAVIAHFEAAGMRDIRPHVLTPAERAQVEQALARLPALYRRVLDTHLRHLSFVDGVPGQGTALTSQVGDSARFDITLRASALHESLSHFLTTKERRLFEADASGHTIAIEAGEADALSYLLLHEATHVLDMAGKLTERHDNDFGRGIWQAPTAEGRAALAPQLAASPAAATRFRGAGPIAASRARIHYDALADTPFVSFYATAAPGEDLAELVAWHVVSRRLGHTLSIGVHDAGGALLKRYEPMRFPAVQARLPLVERLLAEDEPGGAS